MQHTLSLISLSQQIMQSRTAYTRTLFFIYLKKVHVLLAVVLTFAIFHTSWHSYSYTCRTDSV